MLERFKEKLQRSIQANAVKSDLSWKDNEGNIHTETVLLKRSRIPLLGDWIRIYPPVDEYGNINWMNLIFGGRRNIIKLLFIGIIVALVLLQFREIFNYITTLKETPCVQACINMTQETINKSLFWP